jgi:hypothetical protein
MLVHKFKLLKYNDSSVNIAASSMSWGRHDVIMDFLTNKFSKIYLRKSVISYTEGSSVIGTSQISITLMLISFKSGR